MATNGPNPQPSERDLAALAALADGTAQGRARRRIEAKVAASPELQAALERQRQAIAVLAVTRDVYASAGLRARIGAERRERAPVMRRRRISMAGGVAIAGAAAALIVALTLPSGTPGAPSVVQAATLATRAPTAAAPVDPAQPKLLQARNAGVPFPNWLAKFGWRAVGARSDELRGRHVVTVFYEKKGKRIGYSIVSGRQLETPAGADVATREGTRLWSVGRDGRLIVTWQRGGHSCVLSGAHVPRDVLLKLAAWKGKGAVRF
jgi:anti-sigma factor RsiW